jgi:uncharacterized membrane protein YozB (DUF420 family)
MHGFTPELRNFQQKHYDESLHSHNAMSELTIWSQVSLVIQMITLVMLVFTYLHYKRRLDMKVHGAMTSAAYALNMLTILFIMIPATIDGLGDISANPSELVHLLIIIHVPLAIVATLLSSYVVFRWVARSFRPNGCRGKRLMQTTMATWIASIVLGIAIYLAHLIG